MTEFYRFTFKYNKTQDDSALKYPDLADGPVSFQLKLGSDNYTFNITYNDVVEELYLQIFNSNKMIYFIRVLPKFGDGATTNLLYQTYNDFRGLALFWEQKIGFVFYTDFKFLEKKT